MRPIDVARLSLQALQRYPLRTSMLLLAIAIGVAAVVTLTAVGEGARRYVSGRFTSLGTHLIIVLPGRAETGGGGIQGRGHQANSSGGPLITWRTSIGILNGLPPGPGAAEARAATA